MLKSLPNLSPAFTSVGCVQVVCRDSLSPPQALLRYDSFSSYVMLGGIVPYPGGFVYDTTYWVRYECIEDLLRAKIWTGGSGDEPLRVRFRQRLRHQLHLTQEDALLNP